MNWWIRMAKAERHYVLEHTITEERTREDKISQQSVVA
jgi:hypothetical protein